jgi:hypothetical protein
MIDWSKWTFHIRDDWDETVTARNDEKNISIFIGNFKDVEYKDDAAQAIKEAVKNAIRKWYISEQLKQWKGQTIPVEDNLDYIENEAKRRGLV